MADKKIAHELAEDAEPPSACIRCGNVQIEKEGPDKFILRDGNGKVLRETDHVFVSLGEDKPSDARWCRT